MHASVGNDKQSGDIASQIQKCVRLDAGLGRAKARPGEQRQTQIDGRGIQGVGRLLQLPAEVLAGVKRTGDGDQRQRNLGPHLPGPAFARAVQRGKDIR